VRTHARHGRKIETADQADATAGRLNQTQVEEETMVHRKWLAAVGFASTAVVMVAASVCAGSAHASDLSMLAAKEAGVVEMASKEAGVVELAAKEAGVVEMASKEAGVTELAAKEAGVVEMASKEAGVTELADKDMTVFELGSREGGGGGGWRK
jgi:hypothetical protein